MLIIEIRSIRHWLFIAFLNTCLLNEYTAFWFFGGSETTAIITTLPTSTTDSGIQSHSSNLTNTTAEGVLDSNETSTAQQSSIASTLATTVIVTPTLSSNASTLASILTPTG